MKKHRVSRVAEMIREVASETILFKLSDPRVKRVTVMSVDVSPDLQHARVNVSVMGTPAQQNTTLKGLQHAAGFIQAQLGDRMRSRYTPSLRFVLDQGVKHSVEITRLINEALGNSASMNPSPAEAALEADLDDADLDEDDDFEDEDEGGEEEVEDEQKNGDEQPPAGRADQTKPGS
ncbi:MAG: 30S ribosome-binding factor RbfA [Gemmataceae bacterium]|jgi:ribosome-binding factor A|nr:30S ribosome-binding factor RbfA [Gemmataceae bacterium]